MGSDQDLKEIIGEKYGTSAERIACLGGKVCSDRYADPRRAVSIIAGRCDTGHKRGGCERAFSEAENVPQRSVTGLESPSIEVTRVYIARGATEFPVEQAEDILQLAREVDGKAVSGFVRASKPSAASATEPMPADVSSRGAPACSSY